MAPDTRYKSIRYEADGRIATIRLNRPEVLNAIGFNIPREIETAVKERDSGKPIALGVQKFPPPLPGV